MLLQEKRSELWGTFCEASLRHLYLRRVTPPYVSGRPLKNGPRAPFIPRCTSSLSFRTTEVATPRWPLGASGVRICRATTGDNMCGKESLCALTGEQSVNRHGVTRCEQYQHKTRGSCRHIAEANMTLKLLLCLRYGMCTCFQV
jgi:hypothetical protein